MAENRYNDMLEETKDSLEYLAEASILDFTEEIVRLMDEQGVSRSQLAQKIGSSPAYVTKLLRGNVNFTLTTMAKLAQALSAVVRIHLAPENVIVRWVDEQATTDSAFKYPAQSLAQNENVIVFRPAELPHFKVNHNSNANVQTTNVAEAYG